MASANLDPAEGRGAAGFAPRAFWIVLALAAAVASRAPFAFLDRPYHDEPIYALIASYWLEGLIPYRDAWDVKGPGLFALYAFAQALGAEPLACLWILPLLASVAMAAALVAMGEEWFGDARVGGLAAIVFAVYGLAQDGARGPAILLAAPFIAWGLLLALRPRLWQVAAGGCLLGCAVTILQSSAFEAAFAFALVLLGGEGRMGVRALRAGALALGGVAPALGFGALFYAQGALHDLWEATVVVALARSVNHGVGLFEALAVNLRWSAAPFLPLFTLAGVLVVLRTRLNAREDAGARLIALWFACVAAAVLLQRAAYTTYMFALLAPLSLAAGLIAVRAWDGMRAVGERACACIAAALILVYPTYWLALETAWRYSIDVLRETARLIETRAREPGESAGLYAVDYEASLHLLTGQRPVSRFLFSMHLHCNFTLPDGISAGDEILRIFGRAPRFVVRRHVTAYRGCIDKDLSDLIYAVIEAFYEPIGSRGRLGEVQIYELREGAAEYMRPRPP
jgi:hypothetical protein